MQRARANGKQPARANVITWLARDRGLYASKGRSRRPSHSWLPGRGVPGKTYMRSGSDRERLRDGPGGHSIHGCLAAGLAGYW